jgi:hypothetical protein
MPAVNGSESVYRAADVQGPRCKPTAVCADDFVRRECYCGDRTLPQTATAVETASATDCLKPQVGPL